MDIRAAKDRNVIAITGLGVLACNGLGRRAHWDALADGRSGIGRISRFDASELPCQIAGELHDFHPEDFMKKNIVRTWCLHVQQALASARMAAEDAGLEHASYDPDRVATGFGTSVGGPNEQYQAHQEAYESGGYRKVGRLASSKFAGHSATVHVSVDWGFRGPAITISSGCSTGLDMVAWGVHQLQSGRADAALVGATESPIFPMSMAAACSLGILSRRNDEPEKAMRPFDRHRDGIVLSEGAVALVLERLSHARARGARILGLVGGFGAAAEAISPLILDPEGLALSRAIASALHDAGASPGDIDHIQSHGVSLEMYDRCETNAYKRAFGDKAYRVPISAVKSMVGQSYSSGGLFGVSGALMALHENVVAPTINLEDADPACDLDFVAQSARLNDVRTALVVSMSFGGTHTALVLKRAS
ncbi:MAG: beta-ketoacyl-[acyl-carrier-protein] synthase family protein [Candidatus Hydrogenedentes bacterium]|nr:beta-ketoacyl-[acyl-carrier-protein] synthase family protein [Candidatus Hydrogenedentota bacterium]